MNQIRPVLEKERIISLDMMRGFAILGIFLVNMLSFHSPYPYLNPGEWWGGPADKAVYSLIDIFVQASFYTLFSLLFGYSLVIFRERAISKGLPFGKMAVRRLLMLLIIGMIHAFFIWHGDILITYALMGFLFLLFIKLKGKSLLIIGACIYIIPNVLLVMLLAVAVLFDPAASSEPLYDPQLASEALANYQNGTVSEIFRQRFNDWYMANNLASLPVMIISILPLFLIGGGAAKLKWLEAPKKHWRWLRILMISGLAGGMAFKLVPYILGQNLATDYMQDIFGGPLLAIGYGLGIALLAEKTKMKKILYPFSYIGKLSMSNYLFQSIIATFIFYHYGLGFYGKVSVLTGTILVILIYLLQIVLSRLWISTFYYGPVEWVWRSFTYFNLPKLKRDTKSPGQ
jgi:uncharacterized protein